MASSMTNAVHPTESPFEHLTFPRTGKRGVPQQFPRRLYEMLDSETKLLETSPAHEHSKIISWSDSGTAFRIYNVTEFSVSILSKYFRTKKFSSFQRNLNLYGFTKVRRGPDTDMYTHPSFLRNHPESLLQLRKINTAPAHRNNSTVSTKRSRRRSTPFIKLPKSSRPVSPSTSNSIGSSSLQTQVDDQTNDHCNENHHFNSCSPKHMEDIYEESLAAHINTSTDMPCKFTASKSLIVSKTEQGNSALSVSPSLSSSKWMKSSSPPSFYVSPRSTIDRGKLDLLAFALEKATEDF